MSDNGFFDNYGGKYVAEVLRRPLDELEVGENLDAEFETNEEYGNTYFYSYTNNYWTLCYDEVLGLLDKMKINSNIIC